jgi:uncharacterized protein YkwD
VAVVLAGYLTLAGSSGAHPAGSGSPLAARSAGTGPPAASVSPSPGRRRARSASPSPSPSAQPSRPSAPPPSTPASAPVSHSAAASVLALINQARQQAGLPAYTVLSGLVISAGKHNRLMAAGCGLSHQCPGEPALGQRENNAGVQWTAAGENIGEGGPVADTSASITSMAVLLTQDMLNEKPPDDGHRLNILSSSFTHAGIVVSRSSDGTVWMTQDFAN